MQAALPGFGLTPSLLVPLRALPRPRSLPKGADHLQGKHQLLEETCQTPAVPLMKRVSERSNLEILKTHKDPEPGPCFCLTGTRSSLRMRCDPDHLASWWQRRQRA